jgi:transcriptional regulator with XRE-family HTH domain
MGVIPSAEELAGLLIHKRIRVTREGLGLSQPAFAQQVGVNERQVKRWESEKAGNFPAPANAERIGELADRPAELYCPQEGDWADMRAFVAAVERLEALTQAQPVAATARAGGHRIGVVKPVALPAQPEIADVLRQILGRLEQLSEQVAGLPKARDVERGFAALEALIDPGSDEAPPGESPGGSV